ncbi:MAG: putative histidine kinase, hybrid [Herminiimonas sp.]|nr:putative histidine kinase, hybrid [Herminiimonas sp.]
MRIRSRLLILVIAVLLPAVLGAGIGIHYVYTEQQESYRSNMREVSRAMALVLDKEIAKRQMLLHALAASPALAADDLETFYQHAHALASTWENTIFLSDLSGQQFLNTREPLGTYDLPKSFA